MHVFQTVGGSWRTCTETTQPQGEHEQLHTERSQTHNSLPHHVATKFPFISFFNQKLGIKDMNNQRDAGINTRQERHKEASCEKGQLVPQHTSNSDANPVGVRSTESIKLWLWMQWSRQPSPLGVWNVHKGLMWHKEANLTSRFSSKPRLITTASKSSASPPASPPPLPPAPPEFTLNCSSTEEMCPEPPRPPSNRVVPLCGSTEANGGGSTHPVYTRRHALLTFQ